MDGIKVRGHHLRNLHDLRKGYGIAKYADFYFYYAWDKSNGAAQIYKRMIENPFLKIEITDSLDNICIICGRHDGTKCVRAGEDEKKHKVKDRETINKFVLTLGRTYSSDDLLFKLMKNIEV